MTTAPTVPTAALIGNAKPSIWDVIGSAFIAWLYVLAGLCLLPVLAVALVFIFLGFVPQSQEVLYALTETVAADQVNRFRLLSTFAAQLTLAVTIWYFARLLCTIDADFTVPSFLRSEHGSAIRQNAVTWAPRVLGFLAAAALSLAVLFAATTAVMKVSPLLLATIMLVLGPLLIALNKRFPAGRILSMCVVFTTGLLIWILFAASDLRIVLFLVVVTGFPALLLLALDTRRKWLRKLFRIEPDTATTLHTLSNRKGRIAMLFLAGIVGATALALIPVEFVSNIGPAAVVLLTISILTLLLAPLTMAFRNLFHFTPGWPALVTLFAFLLVAWLGKPQYGNESLSSRQPKSTPSAVIMPSPSGEPLYYFAVNAHGGGLRAALFTGLVLARLDDITCGQFGQGLVAASGVSGGSLGIGMYLSLRQDFVARGGWKCTVPNKENPPELQKLVAYALGKDHLSPVVARLAFNDIFLPGVTAKRGQALLDSWQAGAVESIEQVGTDIKVPAYGLARTLADLNGGLVQPPLVYFNTTDGPSGQLARFATGTVGTFQRMDEKQATPVPEITVGEAVLHSARFPLVSPPGKFSSSQGRYTLLDGGYVDNSGAITLTDILRRTNPRGVNPEKIYVLNIDGNPPPGKVRSRVEKPGNDFGLEFSTLLKVRSANAYAAVVEMKAGHPEGKVIDLTYDLESAFRQSANPGLTEAELLDMVSRQRQAPLGWFISQSAQLAMDSSARAGGRVVCSTIIGFCAAEQPNAVAALR